MRGIMRVGAAAVAGMFLAISGSAQEASAPPVALTLKRAIELALQNSKDIQVAKIQASVADKAALINKAQFMPNVYAGSGLGYTYGIPETPGGRAPAIFNVTYTEQVINEPLRGQGKEQQEQVRSQKIALEDMRNSVIVRTASGYLELVKVRHSAELLQKEQESAEKILGVVKERAGEGYGLPVDVTRAQLTRAQADFTLASASTISLGMRSLEILKCSSERCVCAPHSRSAGTSMGPNESRSMRVALMVCFRARYRIVA